MPGSESVEPNPIDHLFHQLDHFILDLREGRRYSFHTARCYTADIVGFLHWWEPQIQHRDISWKSIDHRLLRRYLAWLDSQKLARRSVVRKLSAIKSLFKWLYTNGFVTDNPAAQVLTPKVPRPLPDSLSQSEVQLILEVVKGETPIAQRDRALLEFLYGTGIRVSEAVALNLEDLQPDEGVAMILQGKGGKQRMVVYGRCAQQALNPYLKAARLTLLAAQGGCQQPAAVWLNKHGKRLSAHAIYMMVRQRAMQAGLAVSVTPHTLRHTFATHLLEGGADLRVVQELLGHRNLSSTQIYTKTSPAHLRRVYRLSHPRSLDGGGKNGGSKCEAVL